MAEKPTSKIIAKEFLKLSLEHRKNRCDQCGRRLKLQPGAFLNMTMSRFLTCRSCGYENPTLLEKVAQSLAEQGYEVPSEIEGTLNMPQCFGDGTELQVSRDFTKVFCSSCGRDWDRYEYEDLMGGPLNPALAGALTINPDESKDARNLEKLLELNGVDFSTIYYAMNIERDPLLDEPIVKAMWGSIKQGWKEGLDKADGIEKPLVTSKFAFVALFEDYLGRYVKDENKELVIEEYTYEDFVNLSIDEQTKILSPAPTKKIAEQFNKTLNYLVAVMRQNKEPRKDVLFGSAAKAKHAETDAKPTNSVTEELEKLLKLKESGALSEEEFTAAKKKLLGI